MRMLSLPSFSPERARWVGVSLVAVVAFLMGFMIATPFRVAPFDVQSYVGGISFVVSRQPAFSDGIVLIEPYPACKEHVAAGMNVLDGYYSDTDFLRGCRDAAHYLSEKNAGDPI